IGKVDFDDLERNSVPPADPKSIVTIDQDHVAFPNDERAKATFCQQPALQKGKFIRRRRWDQRGQTFIHSDVVRRPPTVRALCYFRPTHRYPFEMEERLPRPQTIGLGPSKKLRTVKLEKFAQ